ncbi:MAG TPA: putative glycoside hydrolase [Isosphaeraceae bacterium]
MRRVAGAAGLMILSLCRPAPAQIGQAARPFPDTSNGISVFTDQLPGNMTPAQWQFAATHYVGTQKQNTDWTRQMRTLNPRFIVLHYQLAVGAGPSLFVVGNQWTNDFNTVTNQEGWFLHTDQGSRVRQPWTDWYVMDIRSANGVPLTGWPNYWVSTALDRLRLNENDGVFADSYTVDILIGQVNPPHPWFNDVSACLRNWIPNLDAYGASCARALHDAPENFYYLPNLGALVTTWDSTNYGVGDGGMVEGFALSNSGNYYQTGDWQLQMNRILGLARANKIIIAQSYINDGALYDRWFAVCSYLLTKGPRSYINMFGGSTLSWYPEYKLNLGAYAAGPAANVSAYWVPSWGVYRRDYANGMVLVNPGTSAVSVSLGKQRWNLVRASGGGPVGGDGVEPGSLTNQRVTSVTIPAHSGCVLLK